MKVFLMIIAIGMTPDGGLEERRFKVETTGRAECQHLANQIQHTYQEFGVVIGTYCEEEV
jgi:hypothetical protein